MEWIEVFIETNEAGLEMVPGLLYECGLTGLMVEDGREFDSFLEDPARDWDYIEEGLVEEKRKQPMGLRFFVRDNLHGREQLAQIRASLTSLKKEAVDPGSLAVTLGSIAEEDWANGWRKYFKPFAVGERLLVKPSWEPVGDAGGRHILEIDPGHIFGTGTHESTQLCLMLLEQYTKEHDRVLDLGCGSGILSIAALLFGAGYVDGVDIDPNAIEIATENAERNGFGSEKCTILAGDILTDTELSQRYSGKGYDLVVANIVADVIIALSKAVPGYLKNGGIFLSSGIISEREADVCRALTENGFQLLAVERKKDWVGIAARLEG